MYLNRGNHETKDMNRTYGFEGEAKAKHGEQSYKVSAGCLFLFSGFLTCCSSCSLMHSLPVRLVITIFLKPLLIFYSATCNSGICHTTP